MILILQTMTTLWKGIGATFMVKGIGVATEAAISEFTPLPKYVSGPLGYQLQCLNLPWEKER